MVRFLILALLCSTTGSAAVLFKVACGGPGGAGWVSDVPFASGGSTQAVAGVHAVPFNYLRYAPPNSPLSYSFPLSPGSYSVTVSLIEPRAAQTAGQRVFSIAVNGIVPFALKNIDLFATAGPLTPWSYTFPVTSTGNTLTIAFSSTIGNSVVSGLQIDGDPQPAPMMYLRGLDAKRPACPGAVDIYGATDTRRIYWCDGVSWGPNDIGLETGRPSCPGQIEFYSTTDTKRLYWCDGTAWQGLVGMR